VTAKDDTYKSPKINDDRKGNGYLSGVVEIQASKRFADEARGAYLI